MNSIIEMNSLISKNPYFIKLGYKIFQLKLSGCKFEKMDYDLMPFSFHPMSHLM